MEIDQSKILRRGDLFVTPFITDVLLAKAYLRMLEEGTLDTVFYQSRPSLADFLVEYLTHGRRITLGCFREIPDAEPEFAGFGFAFAAVKMDKFVKAECGMCFFRKQSRKTDNVAFGRMMLSAFFEQHAIDVIVGTTPEANRLALRYSQRLGFTLTGPVPAICTWHGELSPGWISTLTKSDWLDRGR